MGHHVFLALGSNLGDRIENFNSALVNLQGIVKLESCSSVYETPPWGILDQPPFLNMVVGGETDLPPAELLAGLKQIEKKMGRVKSIRYGPRLIDLDILFYDDLKYNKKGLIIPHPRLEERAFVLIPLDEIAPNFNHPLSGATVQEMLEDVDPTGIQLYCKMEWCENGMRLRENSSNID
jgi:2-amino-4-hydroxy-6-hydroxymethyldihydropteridine diphosphokinase